MTYRNNQVCDIRLTRWARRQDELDTMSKLQQMEKTNDFHPVVGLQLGF